MESSGVPLRLDLQVPESVHLTHVLRNQGSESLELILKKIPETLELLSQSWPQVKDLGESYTRPVQEVTDLKRRHQSLSITLQKLWG